MIFRERGEWLIRPTKMRFAADASVLTVTMTPAVSSAPPPAGAPRGACPTGQSRTRSRSWDVHLRIRKSPDNHAHLHALPVLRSGLSYCLYYAPARTLQGFHSGLPASPARREQQGASRVTPARPLFAEFVHAPRASPPPGSASSMPAMPTAAPRGHGGPGLHHPA